MIANKKVVEQRYQGTQEGIELAQALGAAVQGSMLRMGQLNREFFEELAAVKAPNELLGAQADYLQKCGQVAQETVLDLAKLSYEGTVGYWGRFGPVTEGVPSQAAEPVPAPAGEAEAKVQAPSVSEPVVREAARADVKPDVKPVKPEAKPEVQAKAPAKKAASKPRRPRRTANKTATAPKATTPKTASPAPSAESPAKAPADPVPTLTREAEPVKPAQTPVTATPAAEPAAPKASTAASDAPSSATGNESRD